MRCLALYFLFWSWAINACIVLFIYLIAFSFPLYKRNLVKRNIPRREVEDPSICKFKLIQVSIVIQTKSKYNMMLSKKNSK